MDKGKKGKIDISTVIPMYKNEEFIDELVSRLKVVLTDIFDKKIRQCRIRHE